MHQDPWWTHGSGGVWGHQKQLLPLAIIQKGSLLRNGFRKSQERKTACFLLSWCYSPMITFQVTVVKTSERHRTRSSTSGRRSGGTHLWRSLRMTKCEDRLPSHLYLCLFPSPLCWSLLSTCILGGLWLPGLYGFRNLLMWNNNKQMKEVIENITGHNFNKCWLLSLCSLVFIVLYTANRSKCFVFLTNISCNHKLTHFSAKSDISS